MPTIADTQINRGHLLSLLYAYRNDLKTFPWEDLIEPGGDEPSGDCRLQVHNGSWYFHTGDSSYDQDHRGYWGEACVSPDDTMETLELVADDLLGQAADHFCESKED